MFRNLCTLRMMRLTSQTVWKRIASQKACDLLLPLEISTNASDVPPDDAIVKRSLSTKPLKLPNELPDPQNMVTEQETPNLESIVGDDTANIVHENDNTKDNQSRVILDINGQPVVPVDINGFDKNFFLESSFFKNITGQHIDIGDVAEISTNASDVPPDDANVKHSFSTKPLTLPNELLDLQNMVAGQETPNLKSVVSDDTANIVHENDNTKDNQSRVILDINGQPVVPLDINGFEFDDGESTSLKKITGQHIDIGDVAGISTNASDVPPDDANVKRSFSTKPLTLPNELPDLQNMVVGQETPNLKSVVSDDTANIVHENVNTKSRVILDINGQPVVPLDINGFDFDDDESPSLKKITGQHIDVGDDADLLTELEFTVPEEREGIYIQKGIKVIIPKSMQTYKGTYRFRQNEEDMKTDTDDMRICKFKFK